MDEEWFAIDKIVGEILFNNCPESIKSKTGKGAVSFCEKKIKSLKDFSRKRIYYTKCLMKYALSVYDDEKLKECFLMYILDPLNQLSAYGRYEMVRIIFMPFFMRGEKSENKMLKMISLKCYSYYLKNEGRFFDALNFAKDALELSNLVMSKDDSDLIKYRLNYAEC